MSEWREEALGIEPWVGAAIRDRTGYIGTAYKAGKVLVYVAYHKDANRLTRDWHDEATVDLSDPDTLAAFDRRLALRLGAPEEAVSRGVLIEMTPTYPVIVIHGDGFIRQIDVGTDDPLLARVRAWNGVKP